MDANIKQPKTLQEAVIFFADPDNCLAYVAGKRWRDGVVCPTCGRDDVSYLENQRKWQCKSQHPKRQFSAKVGTIFEDSPLPLEKWLPVVWMVVNCKNGISSYEVARAIGVTQKSAWFMLHRIRLAMQENGSPKLGGGNSGNPVEIDETFVGGKAGNMHRNRRNRMTTIGKYTAKTAVMGMLERGGKVKACVIPERKTRIIQPIVRESVAKGSEIHTDEFIGYLGLSDDYTHEVINHLEGYVRGHVSTNGIENFWSLLKRGLN